MATRKSSGDMDWLRLESRIRAELRTLATHSDTRDHALILQRISDIMGEETGRGYELDEAWWQQWERGKYIRCTAPNCTLEATHITHSEGWRCNEHSDHQKGQPCFDCGGFWCRSHHNCPEGHDARCAVVPGRKS